MRRLMTVAAIGGAVFLNAVGINPHGSDAATKVPATNPLILTNPINGARAQMMPTTQWLAQHASTRNSSSTTTSGGLTSSTCTLGTDDSVGDAHPLVNSSATQVDALDLSGFGMSSY